MSTTSISSGVLSASALVFDGKQLINSITVLTDGTNAGTVNIYDNSTNTGKIAASHKVVGANLAGTVVFVKPIRLDTAMYVEVLGTGATAIVTYGG